VDIWWTLLHLFYYIYTKYKHASNTKILYKINNKLCKRWVRSLRLISHSLSKIVICSWFNTIDSFGQVPCIHAFLISPSSVLKKKISIVPSYRLHVIIMLYLFESAVYVEYPLHKGVVAQIIPWYSLRRPQIYYNNFYYSQKELKFVWIYRKKKHQYLYTWEYISWCIC
jgi:hypothetical protein